MGETILSMVRALRNQTSLRVFSPFGTFCTVHVPDEVPFDPVGKPGPIASLRAKRPAQYSIYEYVHRGTPVYVGQTKHTLRKRDQQHRQGGKTYFDRQLNMVMSQHAHIRLICKRVYMSARGEGVDGHHGILVHSRAKDPARGVFDGVQHESSTAFSRDGREDRRRSTARHGVSPQAHELAIKKKKTNNFFFSCVYKMQGFGFCVWWKLSATHPLVGVQRALSQAWKTVSFEPHISVRTRLSFVPSEVPHPPSGGVRALVEEVRMTEEYIPSWDAVFYAIEVPVSGRGRCRGLARVRCVPHGPIFHAQGGGNGFGTRANVRAWHPSR